MRTSLAVFLLAVTALPLHSADNARLSPPFAFKRVGTPTPPPIDLTQYRGKIVVVAFIHTTCPHCQHLTQVLTPMATEYAPKGVQFLGVAFNENAEHLLPGFLGEFHPSFPVGWSTSDTVNTYLKYSAMNPMAFVPHMVVLDRRGYIRVDEPGESNFFLDPGTNLRAKLELLLKPATPAKTAAPVKTATPAKTTRK